VYTLPEHAKATTWRALPPMAYRTDLGPVVWAGAVALASGVVAALVLAVRGGSGPGLIVEFVTGGLFLAAMLGLLGFGVAAALRRAAWFALALGILLMPLLFFLWWALYRRGIERKEGDGAVG